MNFLEMRAKAAEQENARAEAFRKFLRADKERVSKKKENLQNLLKGVGVKAAEETRMAIKAQVDTAIEHEEAGRDARQELLKKMLSQMLKNK